MNFLSSFDEGISKAIRERFSGRGWFSLAAFFSHSGDSWIWCGVLFIFWIFSQGAAQRTLAFWGLGIALTALVVFGLKQLIRRRRPDGEWGAVYRKTDPHSFPSGHAVRGGLIVVLACHAFGLPIALLFILWAVVMIFSRVVTGVHYLLDVFAGFALGLLIGYLLVRGQPWLYRTFAILFDRSLWLPLIKGWFAG